MSATRRIGAVVLAVTFTIGSGSARASAPAVTSDVIATTDAPRIFVAPLVIDGDLPKPVQQELAQRLREGLAKPGLELVDDEASASHLVRATVTVRDRDLDFRIELRDKNGDVVVAHVEELCELCGRTEAADTLTSLGLSLRRRVEIALRPPPLVSVLSDPPGALVQLDGEPFGTTPVELPVAAGKHTLRVTKAGFIPQTRSIDLVNGVRESLSVALQTIPDVPRERRPVRWIVGWAALSTGAVGTLAGVTLLAIHGQPIRGKCKGSGVDADGTCRFLHSTLVPGAVVGAVGVGLLATGIALVVVERRRLSRSSTQARLGLGPLGPALRF